MELQTANDYRLTEMMNDATLYRELHTCYGKGQVYKFFKEANAYISSLKVPYDAVQNETNGGRPPDKNRWLPLVHTLLKEFREITNYPNPGTYVAENVRHRVNWMSKGHTAAELRALYNSASPMTFVEELVHQIDESRKATKSMVANKHHITIALLVMNNLRAMNEEKEKGLHADPKAYEIPKGVTISTHGIVYDETTNFNKRKKTMKPIKVETRTFIDDVDTTNISDEEVFAQIAKMEDEATALSKIKTPSVKIAKRIKRLNKSAVKLAKFVDNR